jgi:hypothetical protein
VKRAGSLLTGVIRGLDLEDGVTLEEIRRRWDTLFRQPLPTHMAPFLLSHGELLIAVDSPVWLQELRFRQDDILRKLSPFRVTSVRFKLGKISRKGSSVAQHTARRTTSRPLKTEELALIESTISGVENAELRETIRRAISQSILTGKRKPD